MNFRERFENWHLKTFEYCQEPVKGSTAMNTKYTAHAQQQRWEGWQAAAKPALDLTDQQIIEVAVATTTAEPGTDGYVLPISFARALFEKYNEQNA